MADLETDRENHPTLYGDKPRSSGVGDCYTPGPWMWWDSCSWRRLGTEDQSTLIMEPTIDRSDNHPNLCFRNGGYRGPDARLIAAAPELLEAIRGAMRIVDLWEPPPEAGECDPEREGEYEALAAMKQVFESVIAKCV